MANQGIVWDDEVADRAPATTAHEEEPWVDPMSGASMGPTSRPSSAATKSASITDWIGPSSAEAAGFDVKEPVGAQRKAEATPGVVWDDEKPPGVVWDDEKPPKESLLTTAWNAGVSRFTEGLKHVTEGGKQIADTILPPHEPAPQTPTSMEPAPMQGPGEPEDVYRKRTGQGPAPTPPLSPEDASSAEVVREHEKPETGAWAGVKGIAKGAMEVASSPFAPVGVVAGKGAELSERSTGALTDATLDARIARAEAFKRDHSGAAGADPDVNALPYLKSLRALPYAERVSRDKQQAAGIAEDVAMQVAAGASPALRGLRAARAEGVTIPSGSAPFMKGLRVEGGEAMAALGDYNPPGSVRGVAEPMVRDLAPATELPTATAASRTAGTQSALNEAERIAAGSRDPLQQGPLSQRQSVSKTLEAARAHGTEKPLDLGSVGRRRAQQLAQREEMTPTSTDPAPEINRPDAAPMRVVAEDGQVVHDNTPQPSLEPAPPTRSELRPGETTPAPPTPQDLSDSFFPEHPEGAPTGTRTSTRMSPNISGGGGSPLHPPSMTAGQINKALDKLDTESSKITQEFINQGRGHERPSEIWSQTDDLSRRYRDIANQQRALRIEIEMRYGPSAPSRLPNRGFGPRSKATDLLASARQEDGYLNLGSAVDAVRNWWKQSWLRNNLPMESMVLRARAESPVISDIERWSTGLADSIRGDVAHSPWWKAIRKMTPDALNMREKEAVDAWEAGGRTPQALKQAIAQWPQDLQDYARYRDLRLQGEQAARAYLGLDPVPEVSGPYLPRITDQEAMEIQRVGGRLGVGTGLQTTVKDAMNQRAFATQLDGEAAGLKYIDRRNAILQREWNSMKLSYTAKLVHDLEGKALFRTAAQARAASPTGEAFALEGVPGEQRWWTPTKEEGRFLVQNLDSQPTGGVASFKHYGDALFRNPNLINPLPHMSKNMGMKYLLARGPIGAYELARDAVELWWGTNPTMIARFKEVMPFSESTQGAFATLRREMVRGSAGTAVQKVEAALGAINKPSQKVIFEYADPAMRYSLWKNYVAEGLSDQAAANQAWIDLVRYGTRSAITDMWKSIPMNFFVPWRVGTVTSLLKQIAYHPVRTALTVGGIDYLREMRYRETGRWTHLPWDYVEGPVTDLVQHLASGDVAGVTAQGLTTAAFGPVGETTANSISKLLDQNQRKDSWGEVKRVLWGLSQFSDTRDEWKKFEQDGKTGHLVNIVMGLLTSERSAIVTPHDRTGKPGRPKLYEPKRWGKLLPESLPGLKKSAEVAGAENLQKLAKAKAVAKQQAQGGALASAWKGAKSLASEFGFSGRPGSYSVPPEASEPAAETTLAPREP